MNGPTDHTARGHALFAADRFEEPIEAFTEAPPARGVDANSRGGVPVSAAGSPWHPWG